MPQFWKKGTVNSKSNQSIWDLIDRDTRKYTDAQAQLGKNEVTLKSIITDAAFL
jgi:hypothetical protein